MTKAGDLIRNITYDPFNPLILVALVYLTLVVLLTQLLNLVERKLKKNDKR
jgi:polar amino acid transport system substrate-binding protein